MQPPSMFINNYIETQAAYLGDIICRLWKAKVRIRRLEKLRINDNEYDYVNF